MKVCIFIPNIDKKTGGPSRSVPLLAKGLSEVGVDVTLLTHPSDEMNLHILEGSSVHVSFLPMHYKRSELEEFIVENNFDILQGESMWIPLSHSIIRIARRHSIPYLMVPRGSLEPWSLRQKWFKKKIAWWLYQYKDIRHASCILATAPMEAEHLRLLGFRNPIAVLPNGIDVSEYPCRTITAYPPNKQVLFLSRIHPKKGIELLLEAWETLHDDCRNWKLVIAGNGEAAYIEQLKRKISDIGLNDSVTIIPPIFGESKCALYAQSSLFILPTYSENFGMVVAEAMSCGVPVITTRNAPWKVLEETKSGWWVDMNIQEIVASLKEAMSLPDDILFTMGQTGSKIVNERFEYRNIAKKTALLYEWIVQENLPVPDFVQ